MARSRPQSGSPAAWLAALGDPVRLSMVRVLAGGVKTVAELAEASGGRDRVSYHLRVLRAAELVRVQRVGNYVLCELLGAAVSEEVVELTHSSGVLVRLPRKG
ncbi:MAG TPA: metalloregulator ArsR/SmtB family transcription factor [Gemmata sp.]